MPKWRQTGETRDGRRGRVARLRAGLVVASVLLAPATALLALGTPLTTPAAAQTDGPPPPPSCIPDPSSTMPPDSPTSVPICEDTTTTSTTIPPTTTTTKPTTNTTKPKATTTTTTSPDQGGQQGPGNGFGPAPAGGGPAGGGGPPPGGGVPTVGGALPGGPLQPGATVSPLPGLASLPGYSLVPGTDTLIGPGGVAVTANTRTTATVLALLSPLKLPQRVLNRLFAPFPVAGNATYPGTGSPAGVDITAEPGTQVIASLDGTVHLDQGPGPGQRTATLTGSDGTTHTLSHLDGFAPELVDGQHVSAGDPIGGVGGPSAPGDTPHMHFDIHPLGGPATDPSPLLDQWLTQAMKNAQTLTGRSGKAKQPSSSSGGIRAATKNAAAITPGAATMLPGLAMVGLGVWFGTTRLVRRRRANDAADGLAVEFAGPTDFASKFVIRPPSPAPTQPWWLSWWQPQSWMDSARSLLRERRFKWW